MIFLVHKNPIFIHRMECKFRFEKGIGFCILDVKFYFFPFFVPYGEHASNLKSHKRFMHNILLETWKLRRKTVTINVKNNSRVLKFYMSTWVARLMLKHLNRSRGASNATNDRAMHPTLTSYPTHLKCIKWHSKLLGAWTLMTSV